MIIFVELDQYMRTKVRAPNKLIIFWLIEINTKLAEPESGSAIFLGEKEKII